MRACRECSHGLGLSAEFEQGCQHTQQPRMAAPAQTGAEVEERQFVIQIPELAQEPLLSHVTADTGMTIQVSK